MFFIRLFLANTWKKNWGSPCSFKRKGEFIPLSSLVWEKSLAFCTCTRSCARADDAKIVRSKDAQCNTKELPSTIFLHHLAALALPVVLLWLLKAVSSQILHLFLFHLTTKHLLHAFPFATFLHLSLDMLRESRRSVCCTVNSFNVFYPLCSHGYGLA